MVCVARARGGMGFGLGRAALTWALWFLVPVLTWAGLRSVQRGGASVSWGWLDGGWRSLAGVELCSMGPMCWASQWAILMSSGSIGTSPPVECCRALAH